MAKICLCLTGKTLAQNLAILDKYRKTVDLAELRVDCLDADERFRIRGFPAMAGLPVILTVRRTIDGGKYTGGEGARITLLSNGLAFPEADRRRNFAYLDLEEDLIVPSIEEAARAFGTKIIRSYYNVNGITTDIAKKLRSLLRVGDEIVKVAVMAQSLKDTRLVYEAAKETMDMEKILGCMGDYGMNTRILAEKIGSCMSYTTVYGEQGITSGSAGQLDTRELVDLYRFREISPKTKIFAVTGFPLWFSASPRFFNTVFGIENTDAVYIPVPAESIESFLYFADEIGLSGALITVPYKEAVLPYLASASANVNSIGACNTLVRCPQGWKGYNTDARGFSDSLLEFLRLKDLRRKKISIIGAGGMARAVASVVSRLKGKALILNRTASRARDVALPYGFAWGGLDRESIKLMEKYSDIIIQSSSVGMEPGIEHDPLWFYQFTGKEVVVDLVYKPAKTRCLMRAEQAGCKILNGYDMLLRQARYQYEYFFEKEFPASLIDRVTL